VISLSVLPIAQINGYVLIALKAFSGMTMKTFVMNVILTIVSIVLVRENVINVSQVICLDKIILAVRRKFMIKLVG